MTVSDRRQLLGEFKAIVSWIYTTGSDIVCDGGYYISEEVEMTIDPNCLHKLYEV